jgi:hypothetical protein
MVTLGVTLYNQGSPDVADAPVVHIGENSPEQVAFKLLERIADLEQVSLFHSAQRKMADRKWVLDTYAECIIAVRHPHNRVPAPTAQVRGF